MISAACLLVAPAAAENRDPTARTAERDAPLAVHRTTGPTARAPSGPPLVTQGAGEEEPEERVTASTAEADPLVSNGLGSPSCRSSIGAELASAARRNCETSGFVAAPAPTGNYGLDVHIDTGVFGLSRGGLLTVVQDLFVAPVWMGLLWLVHALLVMLEWGFSINLLEGASADSLESALSRALETLTGPWLALALSCAAVLVVYKGLVRRRVADTLGEAAAMGAMLLGGLWLIVDPSGTVGALSRWSNQAGLGALAVAVQGTPVAPGRVLGTSVDGIFATTVEAPWCYLEFGNVSWCREPDQVDAGLREAGSQIAAKEIREAGCGESPSACHAQPGTSDASLLNSARLLHEARTNGELFLALPANGSARNSINESGSLLRTLCGTSEATSCRGPTAAEAEFRTDGGTWSRVGGLLLIGAGLLGLLMLLGYVVLRLLMAALMAVFYLLLAPAMVLAPAFGERGRATWRSWAVRLAGAVLSKLIFAFLLGVIVTVTLSLESLRGLGWWAQWLLMAAFWWATFTRRHQLLAPAPVSVSALTSVPRGVIARRGHSLDSSRRAIEVIRNARRRRAVPESSTTPGLPPAPRPPAPMDVQAGRMVAVARDRPQSAVERSATRAGELEAQLQRLDSAQSAALLAGDRRRAALLDVRRARVRERLSSQQAGAGPQLANQWTGASRAHTQAERMGAYLDEQAALPAARRARGEVGRDYPALAGLLGMSRERYEGLDPVGRRAARLEIDRELAKRRAALRDSGSIVGSDPGQAPRPHSERPVRSEGGRSETGGSPKAIPRREPESEIMADARAVAEGRKRQLGFGQP